MKVKKGLEKLYRRIEKDLTEEVGMLRVVWGSMQKAFMDQYEHFTKLIEQCYPRANITLAFELKHFIDYFQSISDDLCSWSSVNKNTSNLLCDRFFLNFSVNVQCEKSLMLSSCKLYIYIVSFIYNNYFDEFDHFYYNSY